MLKLEPLSHQAAYNKKSTIAKYGSERPLSNTEKKGQKKGKKVRKVAKLITFPIESQSSPFKPQKNDLVRSPAGVDPSLEGK